MTARQSPPGGAGAPPPAAVDAHPDAPPPKKYSKRAALYLRVSTDEQTTDNQERELRQTAERAGWEITHVYRDEGISGSKGRDRRPGLDAMLKDATRRQFDVVAAWSVDRLGRSLQDLVSMLSDIHAAGIDLYLHQQAIDTTTPAGKAMFQMMGVFAEFERAMIRERTSAGLAQARAEGRIGGRRRKLGEKQRREIAESVISGRKSGAEMARLYHVSEPTVSRIVAAHRQTMELPA